VKNAEIHEKSQFGEQSASLLQARFCARWMGLKKTASPRGKAAEASPVS
jgi:hypothetical protein